MQVLTKSEVDRRIEFYKRKFRESVFIFPTDTIYGIGCDATNGVLVEKVRQLKGRGNAPFSVIAPSKEWIKEHCEVQPYARKWLNKLPGPYTLIFRIKNPEDFPQALTQGKDTLGVRIPNHWIAKCVKELGYPIVSTSANKTGERHIEDMDDIPREWRTELEFVIYEGNRVGTPSKLVHLDKEEVEIQER